MMDLEQLQSVRDRERQSDTLQELRESFYVEASELIADLRAERDRRAAGVDDPFSDPTVRRLSNDIETAEHTLEAIYDRRVGKLVKAATFAAAGQSAPETSGMTAEETDLFESILDEIETNRERVLEMVDGDGDQSPDSHAAEADASPTPGEPDQDPETNSEPPDEQPTATEETDDAETDSADASQSDLDRATVRITEDVGEIFGVDERSYDLSADDVVTLPAANAEPLIERNAAERLE